MVTKTLRNSAEIPDALTLIPFYYDFAGILFCGIMRSKLQRVILVFFQSVILQDMSSIKHFASHAGD